MPKVKHSILSWARETSKLTVEEAAHKLGLKDSAGASAVDKLANFENGTKAPSRSLLIRMAKCYHRPLLTFYLNQPPNMGDRGEDFRTLPDDFEDKENAVVDVLIRDIKARQSMVREAMIDDDEEIDLNFIGKCTMNDGVERIVKTIREFINITLDEYRAQPDHRSAFNVLRKRTEASGIFVLLKGNLGSHHTNIGVTAFRGFALSDSVAPFIVINDRDHGAAWSFTLLHELAHLVLGQTGLSGANVKKKTERFCNDVATEFLLPAKEFATFQVSSLGFETLRNEISEYASCRKLSNTLIAYRLFRRGDINESLWKRLERFYRDKWLEHRELIKQKNSRKEQGPSYYVVQQFKLGALVDLVHRMTYSGTITTTKAGMLLNVKPLKVHRLFLAGQPA